MSGKVFFYASVLGGWVCSACGALVHERDLHVAWHADQDKSGQADTG